MASRYRRRLVGVLVAVAAASLTAIPTPAQAQTACPVAAGDLAVDSEEQQLLDLVNAYRVENGRQALVMDAAVTKAAAWFSRDMATFNYFPFDHVDRNGRNIPTRLTWCGVPWNTWRENIYAGSPQAEDVFTAWRNSASHNTNMLATDITLAGVARSQNTGSQFGWYWVMNYTTPPASGGAATVAGSTWYSTGAKARTGPPGTVIRAYAVGAIANVPYRLVLGTGASDKACVNTVQVLNPNVVFAGANGLIGTVTGTVQAIAPGTYKLCFEDASSGNITGTGGATFTVT